MCNCSKNALYSENWMKLVCRIWYIYSLDCTVYSYRLYCGGWSRYIYMHIYICVNIHTRFIKRNITVEKTERLFLFLEISISFPLKKYRGYQTTSILKQTFLASFRISLHPYSCYNKMKYIQDMILISIK